jgi:hypothetical protein
MFGRCTEIPEDKYRAKIKRPDNDRFIEFEKRDKPDNSPGERSNHTESLRERANYTLPTLIWRGCLMPRLHRSGYVSNISLVCHF